MSAFMFLHPSLLLQNIPNRDHVPIPNDKIISTILPISGELHFSGIAISTGSPGFSEHISHRSQHESTASPRGEEAHHPEDFTGRSAFLHGQPLAHPGTKKST